jgi:hypothetical protein
MSSRKLKVEFAVYDVQPSKEKPLKRRPLSPKRKQQRETKKAYDSPTLFSFIPETPNSDRNLRNNQNATVNIISDTKNNILRSSPNNDDYNSKPIISKAIPSLPINKGNRINPIHKIPQREEAMQFSMKPPDRDRLIAEQDVFITKYRARHSNIYKEIEAEMKSPHFEREECHHDHRNKLTPRDRSLPKTTGTILNNTLPFYPFLNENSTGIHEGKKWSKMTAMTDDPDRMKPVHSRVTKSHDDFVKFYHAIDQPIRNSSVSIQREDLL